MWTTIDSAGRVVIPEELRRAAALVAGQELEIVERDGRIEIEPVSAAVHLREQDGFLAAESEAPALTTEAVRDLLDRSRR